MFDFSRIQSPNIEQTWVPNFWRRCLPWGLSLPNGTWSCATKFLHPVFAAEVNRSAYQITSLVNLSLFLTNFRAPHHSGEEQNVREFEVCYTTDWAGPCQVRIFSTGFQSSINYGKHKRQFHYFLTKTSLTLPIHSDFNFSIPRVGPDVVKDPAFLVTRNMEDFVTWVDTSAIRKKVLEYKELRDDYDIYC